MDGVDGVVMLLVVWLWCGVLVAWLTVSHNTIRRLGEHQRGGILTNLWWSCGRVVVWSCGCAVVWLCGAPCVPGVPGVPGVLGVLGVLGVPISYFKE